MSRLAEIRKKLMQQSNSTTNNNNFSASDLYPFWNLPEGGNAVLRFLPDKDPANTFFWVERKIVRLPFAGIKGKNENKEVIVQVPCVEMYGKTCPIMAEIRPWFGNPELEGTARKYWKKRSYIFQGFVVSASASIEENAPQNPIRRFVINSTIFEKIKASLIDTEIEESPADYDEGRDFKLIKTKRGQYADYGTSNWSMRTRALSDAERAAIDEHGLFDLKAFLPKNPSEKELEMIKEMFEVSVDGGLYDEAAWGESFKVYGNQDRAENTTTQHVVNAVAKELSNPLPDAPTASPLSRLKEAATTRVVEETVETPSVTESDDSDNTLTTENASDKQAQLLEMIRRRRQSK